MTGQGSFSNVTECFNKGITSVSRHTGSAQPSHRTNNGSGVILGDRCPLATQRRDH